MESTAPVQSIQRVFALLEALSTKLEGEGLMRLAVETGLSKSTAHRLLNNLIHLGYVMQNRHSKKFYLTVKLFEV
jgi:DNA-binding IclR family transcriptional regulator